MMFAHCAMQSEVGLVSCVSIVYLAQTGSPSVNVVQDCDNKLQCNSMFLVYF